MTKISINKTFYHYCSLEAFISIIQKEEIWLSYLKLSSDAMEGMVFKNTILTLAERDKISPIIIDLLKNVIIAIENELDGFIFSLSNQGDLLNQWREYASDGSGFSIGFSEDFLFDAKPIISEQFNYHPTIFSPILYNREEQEKAVDDIYDRIKTRITEFHKHKNPKKLISKLFFELDITFQDIFRLKTNNYINEKEYRIILTETSTTKNTETFYRNHKCTILPYKKIPILNKNKAIIEVILGYNNNTPLKIISDLLTKHGFLNTTISKSSIPHRQQ
ncbi:DUF2971 domain-containing protein [Candidatus Roizmanbacteria bacterium]|nr:DUF2971 domain-containing protein [Candidatus Roizmanbacteria bacterium]